MLTGLVGMSTGWVFEWQPGVGFTKVPESDGPMPNGIEASPDGEALYVNLYFGDEVRKISRKTGATLASVEIASPDNVLWSPDGSLLVASHNAPLNEMLACGEIEAGACPFHYSIVELSGALRARQAELLAPWGDRVRWLDALPEALHGVAVGNEVLDAMPVQLLVCAGTQWLERGVVRAGDGLGWAERPTALRPPVEATFVPGSVTEVHPQAEAFIRTLASRLRCGAAFFIDYGFPDREYYHPQRTGGTLMCHRAHRAEAAADSPLHDLGCKDITAHVNFSAIALAGQDAGLEVLGYTSQARFLLNCGFGDLLQSADLRGAVNAQRLITEHEMGELFKVIGFAHGVSFDAIGFALGDRSHML